MHLAAVAGSGIVLLATATLAATGDHLVVTGDAVNVRAGPGTDYRARFQVNRNQPAVELAREGEWVRVELSARGQEGWIHGSLLAVAPAGPSAARAGRAAPAAEIGEPGLPSVRASSSLPSIETALAEPDAGSDALSRFRNSVSAFNERALAAAGVELFTGVEAADSGTVRVLVTETWEMVPPAGQKSYTNALFYRWQAAAGGGSLRVQVVDPSGAVVSEKYGP